MVKTDKYKGKISKGVTVRTNDPLHPAASLQLQANVKTFIDVLPRWNANLIADLGDVTEQVLYLKGVDGAEYDVIGVTSDNQWVKATVEKIRATDPDAVRGDFRLKLRVTPAAPIGPLAGNISVTTTHKEQRYLDVPLMGKVQGPINFFPATVVMFSDQSGRPARLGGTIVLQARPGSAGFEVKEFEVDDERIRLDPISGGGGLVQRLGVTWTSPEDKGLHQGTIRIKTSSEEMPDIQIPFQVRIE